MAPLDALAAPNGEAPIILLLLSSSGGHAPRKRTRAGAAIGSCNLTFFPAGAGDRLVAAVPELPRCLISASVVCSHRSDPQKCLTLKENGRYTGLRVAIRGATGLGKHCAAASRRRRRKSSGLHRPPAEPAVTRH